MDIFVEPFDRCFIVNNTENVFENFKERKIINHSLIVFLMLIAFGAFLLIYQLERKKIPKMIKYKTILFSVAVSIILLPIIFMVLLISIVYQKIVILILNIKLTTRFGGLLQGADVLWAIKDNSNSIISILMIIEYNKEPHQFYNIIKNTVHKSFFADPDRCPKALATLHKFFGYHYLIKNDVTLEDCVKKMRKHPHNSLLKKEDLLALINQHSNEDLPKNNTALWEILVGEQIVDWKETSQMYYPIMIKVHHSLSDGASLLEVLIRMFSGSIETRPHTDIPQMRKSFLKQLKQYWNNLNILFLIPTTIRITKDRNILHGIELSGKKGLVLVTEENRILLDTIKNIKRKFNSVSFSDVLITALSRSLHRYFEKHSTENIPNSVTAIIPVIPDILNFMKKLSNNSEDAIVLSNKLSVALLNIPVCFNGDHSFSNVLDIIKKNTTALRNSIEFQVNFWLLSIVFALLPEPFLRPALYYPQSTFTISNLPGPSKMHVFGGYLLEDIAFWVPYKGTTGLGLSILSYDNRLEMGLSYDEALISNETDAKSLLEGICDYLTLMDNETGKIL